MLLVPLVALAEVLLAGREVGDGNHGGDGKDVRAEHHAQSDVGYPPKGAGDVDADLGAGCREADERAASSDGEAPLPAELLQWMR